MPEAGNVRNLVFAFAPRSKELPALNKSEAKPEDPASWSCFGKRMPGSRGCPATLLVRGGWPWGAPTCGWSFSSPGTPWRTRSEWPCTAAPRHSPPAGYSPSGSPAGSHRSWTQWLCRTGAPGCRPLPTRPRLQRAAPLPTEHTPEKMSPEEWSFWDGFSLCPYVLGPRSAMTSCTRGLRLCSHGRDVAPLFSSSQAHALQQERGCHWVQKQRPGHIKHTKSSPLG